MHERIRTLASCAVLVLITGWILHVGRDVFVPIVFSIFAVYVIGGLARLLGKIPFLGPLLPPRIRYALAVAVIAVVMFEVVYLVIASKDVVAGFAPKFQELLLAATQRFAVYFQIESEPNWTTLRRELVAQIDVQKFIGQMFTSVSSIIVGIELVLLYAVFMLWEHRMLLAKLANLSDPRDFARMREVLDLVNVRIGSYLAVKTFLGTLLGALSWIAMAFVGLEFAAFWSVLIALLNFIPYFGAVLGIAFAVAMAIVQFASPGAVLAVMLPLVAIHVFVEYFLNSYLMGKSLDLGPLAILASLTVWSELWGIPGAFLAIPITALMRIVFAEFSSTRPIAVFLSGNGQL
jgi:AI-2 transport protein TqsA